MLINRLYKPVYRILERSIGLRVASKIIFRRGYDQPVYDNGEWDVQQIGPGEVDEVP